MFSGVVPFMNNNWPEGFEVGFDVAKKFLSDLDSMSTNFVPLSVCFKFHMMDHIISTTLTPRKGSLSKITCRPVFVMYYLIKKIKINWATWIRKYILKSIRDVHAFANLSYGLLITRIILFYSIDLSTYLPVEVAKTYDSRMFSSMGYVLVEDERHKKEFVCAKAEPPKKMPPRRNNERRNRDQPVPSPVQEDPLNEYVSHAKFRAIFTTLAHSISDQNYQLDVAPANPVENTTAVRIWDFIWMNPPLFSRSKFEEDLYKFLDMV
ncbi:hypothetical protein FXO38_07469 [Capsicum annuum]|nr:hypothetical protein FXO38_07469 [Capsicum annuum]